MSANGWPSIYCTLYTHEHATQLSEKTRGFPLPIFAIIILSNIEGGPP